jgi:hypothetical protein
MINFPSLSLVTGYPKYIGELGIARGNTINAVVTTYTGKIILLYNDNYYMEIDECLMREELCNVTKIVSRFNSNYQFSF